MRLLDSSPLYKQINDEFHSRIQNGLWKEGDRVPSERELCDEFSVSRITIRQAIAKAVNEGILETHPGKGTFVRKRKVARGFIRNTTFSEMISDMGKEPKTKILEYKTIPPTIENSKVFDLLGTSKLINLVILGIGDEEPSVVYSSFFPHQLGEKMIEKAKERVSKNLPFSTFDLYQDNVGVRPSKAHQTYEVTEADKETASFLQVPVNSALFLIKSIFYSFDGRALEYREAQYRGDRFIFHVIRTF